MYRIVQIVERSGHIHQIPMTAQQMDFYLRLTELRAGTDPTITFLDVVIEHQAKAHQARLRN